VSLPAPAQASRPPKTDMAERGGVGNFAIVTI
jgi:hypothetical protein